MRIISLMITLVVACLVLVAPAHAAGVPVVTATPTTPDDGAVVPGDVMLHAAYTDDTGPSGTVKFVVCSTVACAPSDIVSRGVVSGVVNGTIASWRITPPLAPGRDYYWKAKAINGGGNAESGVRKLSTPSDERSFTGVATNAAGVTVAVGTGSTIVRAASDNAEFLSLKVPIAADWLAITAMPGTTGGFMAVGRSGAIATSSADGLTWTDRSNATCGTEHLFGVAEVNADDYVAAGANGRVCTSTDGATTWSAANIAAGADLVSMSGVPASVTVVTDAGALLITTDGVNWTGGPVAAVDATSVQSTNTPNVFVGTRTHGIHRSNNGGAFTLIGAGFGGAIHGFASNTNGNVVWAAGGGGLVARTSDAGSTWASWAPSTMTMRDIVADTTTPSLAAIAVGGNRTIVSTADQGATWTLRYSPPIRTAAPTVTGSGTIGGTLTATTGTWTGPGLSFAIAWERCRPSLGTCAPIAGAGGASLTVTAADAGSTLRARVTATNDAGSGSAASAGTPIITAPGAPTGMSPASGRRITTTPTFSARFEDADGETGSLEFQRCAELACTTVIEGGIASPVAAGALGAWKPKPIPTGTDVYWRVRGTDAGGRVGPFSDVQQVQTQPVVYGTAAAEVLVGSYGNDEINAGGGNDRINGWAGNDVLAGGAGNDNMRGCAGNDDMDGGAGNDSIAGCEGADDLVGGTGTDRMDGGTGNDELDGAAGNDTLRGAAGNDRMTGGAGNDVLVDRDGADTLDAGTGNDVVDSRERAATPAKKPASAGFGGSLARLGTLLDERKKVVSTRDVVRCGTGIDRVIADPNDVVAKDCEFVNGRRRKFR